MKNSVPLFNMPYKFLTNYLDNCIVQFAKMEFQLIFKHCSHQLEENDDLTYIT